MNEMKNIPSIARELSRTLWIWFLLFSAAIGLAVWLQTNHEVHELLDDSLIAAADVVQANLHTGSVPPQPQQAILPGTETPQQRFAWQWVSAQGQVLARSQSAPDLAWRASAQKGFFDVMGWRVYGLPATQVDGMLYVAQSQAERQEASVEVAVGAVLAILAVGIVGQLWLRRRIAAELRPIKRLSERMLRWNTDVPNGQSRPWGLPERQELQPVHAALDTLSQGLQTQLTQERAFSAHTSHALRTPLAGIDTQLAVALRETYAEQSSLRERLEKLRHSTQRMQRVVESLLSLFRHGGQTKREKINLEELMQSIALPENLTLNLSAQHALSANADLLSAALFNLLDNSVRYGAQTVFIQTIQADELLIRDDGPGIQVEHLSKIQTSLSMPSSGTDVAVGMGLWLAHRVAVAHSGSLSLHSAQDQGLTVRIETQSACLKSQSLR
ncbi:MAG: HAMP domain-containing histidine kinase, partial [Brachymonas sp.]|nr:HAMP domain-containing histidine kinase [Brachymonas sp.]